MTFPFQWFTVLPCLGICLSSTHGGLCQTNFPSLFRKLTKLLYFWSRFPLFWFGRINAMPFPTPSHVLHIHQCKDLKFYLGVFKFSNYKRKSIYPQDQWWPLSLQSSGILFGSQHCPSVSPPRVASSAALGYYQFSCLRSYTHIFSAMAPHTSRPLTLGPIHHD